jgi:CRP-like cAMP-binding protein/tRNA A-37 threonylcarbamoyl transferase component Bud32
MVPMTKVQCDAIAEFCWEKDVAPGEEIIKQGVEEENPLFYIVRKGNLDVKVTSKTGAIVFSGQVGVGQSFGELALIYSSPRAATITAAVDSNVWCIDRVRYQELIADASAKEKLKMYLECLDRATFFDSLTREEKEAVANSLTEMEFEEGESVFEQGEIGTAFYVLIDGEVAVFKDDKQVAALTGNKEKATIFGELALLTSEPRAATIKVVSDLAKVMYMDKDDFDVLLAGAQKGGDSDSDEESEEDEENQVKMTLTPDGKITLADLDKVGILGCGGFGVVHYVVHKKSNKPYALKSLNKGHIIKCKMKDATIREKKIQMMCETDFIVKLHETFNDPQALLFLMELVSGGELYDLYERNALHGNEGHAKYYVGSVALAFEHMHGKKIIYRDLKPENLLLTEQGKLKVTDMGLAKVVIGKTRTVCGTPDYFAPEMIAREGYTNALDWWTLGILTFELMVGKAPFSGAGNVMVQIKKGIKSVRFPPKTQGPLENLIKGLCETKPASRLTMKKGGIDNIKNHDWFKDFKWEALADGSMPPPFKPEVKGRDAIKQLSWSAEDMPPQLPYTDDGSGWDKDFASSS